MHERSGFGRRSLLKGAAGASVAAGLFGFAEARAAPAPAAARGGRLDPSSGLAAHPVPTADASSEGYWAQVRKAFVLPDGFLHLNTGTTGSQPAFSLQNLAVYDLYKSLDPRDWQANLANDFPALFPLVNGSALTARQEALARTYHANPGEIVLSYSTTDAMNLVFAGIPWRPGDRIVTTSFEHPAMAGPIARVRDQLGVEVVVLEMPSSWTATVPEVVAWFDAALAQPLPAGARQFVAFSEIFYKNGIRMPVKELCAAARARGAWSIVDTAHGWGMLPIDCKEYGADFLAGAGHKWLCGGPGTGILYVRNDGSDLPPFDGGNWASYGNLFTAPSARYGQRNFAPSAIQSRGETNAPALLAMADSAAFFADVGLGAIRDRGLALAAYFQRKVAGRWGPRALALQSPDPRYKTFITAFNPFRGKDDASQLAASTTAMNAVLARLAAGTPKINVRTVTWRDSLRSGADDRIAFRVSTHAMYNDWDQLDLAFDRLVAEVDATGLPQL